MLTGDWKGPSGRPSWSTHNQQVDIKHINIWPKWIDNVSFTCPKVRTICRQQLISFLKNHGEFFKDRDFHQHVKMLFSGAEDVKEEEEHNEFFHIPEQVPILDVATLFGWPILPGDVQGFCEHCPAASRGADLQRGLAEGVLKLGTCHRSRGTTDQSVKRCSRIWEWPGNAIYCPL